jgi:hypothetical protein
LSDKHCIKISIYAEKYASNEEIVREDFVEIEEILK